MMKNKGLFLVFSTAVISGFSVFINKYAVALGDPTVFAFLKNSVVAIFLTALILAAKDIKILRRLSLKRYGLLALIGLVGGSIPFLLFFKGLSMSGAAQGSFIHKTMFVYVAILAAVFLKEKISRKFFIGALALLAGNVFLLKTLNFSFGYGDLLILLATLLWAGENIISKYALRELSGNIVAWGRMFFGSIFIFILLLLAGQFPSISTPNPAQIISIAATAVLLFGYNFTWYNGLKTVSVSTATAILMLGSPVTTALSAIAAGKINPKEIASGALVIFGLIIIFGFDFVWRQVKNRLSHVRT